MDGEIQPDRLATTLEDGEPPVLVDIRQPAAFEQGHIPGSVNLPLSELTAEIEQLEGSDHVVTICPHGQASVKAARLIAAWEGFDGRVESLAGGLQAWTGPFEEGTIGDPSDEVQAPF